MLNECPVKLVCYAGAASVAQRLRSARADRGGRVTVTGLSLLVMLMLFPARAMSDDIRPDDLQEVLRLWAQQEGEWVGQIEIYGPEREAPAIVGLSTRWDAVPDHAIVTKIETFSTAQTQSSAVTLMFASADRRQIVTPYFINGEQRNYHFAVDSLVVTDDTHWTTVITSPDGQEIYEDRPAILRYVRTRNGNLVENTKEVRFLDGGGSGEFELRSLIRQEKVSPVMTRPD